MCWRWNLCINFLFKDNNQEVCCMYLFFFFPCNFVEYCGCWIFLQFWEQLSCKSIQTNNSIVSFRVLLIFTWNDVKLINKIVAYSESSLFSNQVFGFCGQVLWLWEKSPLVSLRFSESGFNLLFFIWCCLLFFCLNFFCLD